MLPAFSDAFPLSPRAAMVESQIAPNGVVDPALLDAFRTLPREAFVPDQDRGTCYADRLIDLGEGRILLSPMVMARMMFALSLAPGHRVLDVAGGTGYGAAIMALRGAQVFALEETGTPWHQRALAGWLQTDCFDRITAVAGSLRIGWLPETPYDAIMINGAFLFDPVSLISQVKPGGSLVGVKVTTDRRNGVAMLYKKSVKGSVSSTPLFETMCPVLSAFDAQDVFVFS